MDEELARRSRWQTLWTVAVLALLYIATGKLGLLLAVPPGYATIIWPPSGIAAGMLMRHGRRVWPGVFLGSLFLNVFLAGPASTRDGLDGLAAIGVVGTAISASLQALAAATAVKYYVGLPLRLRHPRDIPMALALAGPICCLIQPTLGSLALYATHLLPPERISSTWLTWWAGATWGVLVFLPLVLVAPGNPNPIKWRGKPLSGLPILAMLILTSSLGLSYYAFRMTTENAYSESQARFQALAVESEKALLHRIDTYNYALLGGAGFFQGSNFVARDEWRSYVETLDVQNNFPGILGLGWIARVPQTELPKFLKGVRQDNAPNFRIHPATPGKPNYIITYVEPLQQNRPAVGLNIAFDANRLEAANHALDTGESSITKRVFLVQDAEKSPGFLLLHPMYRLDVSTDTVAERRAAFRGWIYAPLVAKNFLSDLTETQGQSFNLRIYDGEQENQGNLIYDSSDGGDEGPHSLYAVRKTVPVMQERWLMVWESTEQFEKGERNDGPTFVLLGGLLFTGVFGIFLLMVTVNRPETMQWLVEERKPALTLFIFFSVALGSFYLYKTLKSREMDYVKSTVEAESKRIEQSLGLETTDKLLSLKRMAQRWEMGDGTPQNLWREDARHLTEQLKGLHIVAWMSPDYRLRWVEPGTTRVETKRLESLATPEMREALQAAADANSLVLTPPVETQPGQQALVGLVPLTVAGRFDGCIVGVLSTRDFFDSVLAKETAGNFAVTMQYEGHPFFRSSANGLPLITSGGVSRDIHVFDKNFQMRVDPTDKFVSGQLSSLPATILTAGILIGGLLALTVRYVLIARIKSDYLLMSEEQTRLLVRHAPAAIAMFDRDLRYIMTSDRWIRDYKLEGREIIGKGHYEIFPEIARMPHWLDIHQRALNGENFELREESWVRDDGETEWVQWAIHPWINARGQIGGVVMFTEVITERKQAELAQQKHTDELAALARQLEATNRLNSAVLESAKYLIIATDIQGKVIVFNREAEQALGYAASEVVGTATPELWHDSEELIARSAFLSQKYGTLVPPGLDVLFFVPRQEGSESNEWIFKRRNGSRFQGSQTVTPMRDGGGNIDGFLYIIEDVTERQQALGLLKTSEETFRSAMEHAPIGMAMMDMEGRILRVNQALSDLFGFSKEYLLAADFRTVAHPEDVARDLEFVESMLAGTTNIYQAEIRYIHRDGHTIWGHLSLSLVRGPNGEPNYFIAQILNISEQKEMERLKDEFISIVSHELRTPLTSIRGSLGLVNGIMSQDLPEKARNLVDIALKNSERLILLINDILDIDKIASGKMTFNLKPEPVSGLLNEAVESNQAYASKYGVSLMVHPVPHGLQAMVDGQRFTQVLTNLISNAVKFSPQGGRVEISARAVGEKIHIEVEDHGQGIPPEFRSRIFGKFSQLDSSSTRAKGGSGLGLHISKQLVEHMDGNIGFESEVGQGTTFWLEFPRADVSGDAIAALPEPEVPVATSILICEFDAEIAHKMQDLLGRAGFHSDTASTATQAKELLSQNPYSAMALDLMLPQGEAMELIRDVRQDPRTVHLPVIAISSRDGRGRSVLNGEAVSIVDWLAEPTDSDALLQSVQKALTHQRSTPRILHVEDDIDLVNVLATALGGRAIVVPATTVKQAKDLLKSQAYGLVIIDLGMPDGSGLALLEDLRDAQDNCPPVLILSASETPAELQRQVAAALVKSRTSETKIVETILQLTRQHELSVAGHSP